jgi:hypothetical protein
VATLPEGLLDLVKNSLDITWSDPATDANVAGSIARGIAYLDRTAGKPQDYISAGQAQMLLLEYCRYYRSNAVAEYEGNLLHELLSLQIEAEVSDVNEN